MLHHSSEFDSWDRCPPGALRELREGLRSAEQVRQRRRVAMGAAASAVLFVAFGLLMPSTPAPSSSVLGCGKVATMLAAYRDNQLSDTERDQVAAHLKDCIHCRRAYEEIRREGGGERRQGASADRVYSTAAIGIGR